MMDIDGKHSVLRRFLGKVAKAVVPGMAQIDLTYACNLRCVHCCVVPEDRPELDTGEVKRVLEELAAKNCLYVALSGGEIFLRQDLDDILQEAHGLRFTIVLMTNGTLIPEDLIPRLPKLGVGQVNLSLYGDVPDVHDRVTQVPGSFEKTVASVRRLKDSGMRVRIGVMLLTQNAARIRQMAEFAEGLGTVWNIDPTVSPKRDGSTGPLAFRASESDLAELFEYYEARTGDVKRMVDAWQKEEWLSGRPCAAGTAACAISPYGDVFPCGVLRLAAGNVREKPFGEIWEHSEVLRRVRAVRRRDLKPCATCDLAPYCIRCQGRALAEDGDLLGPSRYQCVQAAVRRDVLERTYAESTPCKPTR